MQTLRSALAAIDKHRQHLVSHQQHTTSNSTSGSSNANSDCHGSVARGRTSVTASFYDRSLFGRDGGTGLGEGSHDGDENPQAGLGEGEGVEADMTFHELAALQLVSNKEDIVVR